MRLIQLKLFEFLKNPESKSLRVFLENFKSLLAHLLFDVFSEFFQISLHVVCQFLFFERHFIVLIRITNIIDFHCVSLFIYHELIRILWQFTYIIAIYHFRLNLKHDITIEPLKGESIRNNFIICEEVVVELMS